MSEANNTRAIPYLAQEALVCLSAHFVHQRREARVMDRHAVRVLGKRGTRQTTNKVSMTHARTHMHTCENAENSPVIHGVRERDADLENSLPRALNAPWPRPPPR